MVKEVLDNMDIIISHMVFDSIDEHYFQWRMQTKSIPQHICFLFFTLGKVSSTPFPLDSLPTVEIFRFLHL